LEQRIRAELQRLLGRQVRSASAPSSTNTGLKLELLEGRIREIVRLHLGQGAGQPSPDGSFPAGLDLDLLESQMRALIRRKQRGEADAAGSVSVEVEIDRHALERRVRQEIEQAISPRSAQGGGGDEVGTPLDRRLLERRVRSEMVRRIPSLGGLGWDGLVWAEAELPLESDLLADRMRKSIRRALRDYRVIISSRLTDDEIERMIGRLLP
jgi:hypothetical protein